MLKKSKNVRKIIVGNWKMNPQSLLEAKEIFRELKKTAEKISRVDVIVCPPYPYLLDLKKIAGNTIHLGSQDVFFETSGSFTGFISGDMVKNTGADFAIVGHSERRERGETSETVNKKILSALKSNLGVILCIGEKERSSNGEYLAFIRDEIHNSLAKVSKKFLSNIIIAYEPVWAIGRKDFEAMSPRDIHEMVIYIRKILTDLYGKKEAQGVPILYGGSVNPRNAHSVIFEGEVDGLLVGRESLEPSDFGEILKMASERS